ncbi:UNVERIFIED_CONTAM: Leucine-rich repeat receptor-like serine/threonine/tyrosine-protein kinase SOBIR1 [Sesamum latifolium]|uniref:Leucine-rich repeat receptor-like serine/threonine/tyrosine-protein kinase SOBIR1 n=1 Tax=Sesamum latifolium TaxID=2727402 RepID=A0AAW2UIQ9_9LAMI
MFSELLVWSLNPSSLREDFLLPLVNSPSSKNSPCQITYSSTKSQLKSSTARNLRSSTSETIDFLGKSIRVIVFNPSPGPGFVGKQVPVSLRSFRNLRFINLSGNGLIEGPLPLMHNDLDQYLSSELAEERIPKRYVFAEVSQGKNQSLSAEAPASSQGSNGAAAPSPMAVPSHKHKKNEKKKILGWVLGFLAGGLAGIVSGMVFSMLSKLLLFLIRGRGKDSSLKIFSPLIKRPEDLAFLENEDGLASLDVIGRGGCGEVFQSCSTRK